MRRWLHRKAQIEAELLKRSMEAQFCAEHSVIMNPPETLMGIASYLTPPLIIPRGYVILDFTPGAINEWRELYYDFALVPRPLAKLKRTEEALQ